MAKLKVAFHNFANASKSVFIGFCLTSIIRDHVCTYILGCDKRLIKSLKHYMYKF